MVPHPFLGYVYNPRFNPAAMLAFHSVPASDWGFLDDKAPLRAPSHSEVVIGIFGGSVAFWFSVKGVDAMLQELGALPELRGKRLVVVRTALGAFKQPQQLMTLNYLLALGGHFDIVVNLDGFNEIALAPGSEIPKGIFPWRTPGWRPKGGPWAPEPDWWSPPFLRKRQVPRGSCPPGRPLERREAYLGAGETLATSS